MIVRAGLVTLGIVLSTVWVAVFSSSVVDATTLPFTLSETSSTGNGPTLLVIGGIQGDEPGGFNAASLLVTHYRIHHGRLWVVPNLNFESIIKRSRGVYGDMNRKFPTVAKSDPDEYGDADNDAGSAPSRELPQQDRFQVR